MVGAQTVETGEIVAIKRLKKAFATWEECLSLREVAALTKLKHANIVRFARRPATVACLIATISDTVLCACACAVLCWAVVCVSVLRVWPY